MTSEPMDDTQRRLVKCFRAVFPKLKAEDARLAVADDVPDWDSVAMVTLLRVIEEEFGVALDFADLEELTSFSGIYQHITSRKLG